MVIVLYHEVIQGERVQGTMFPAGAWGNAPKPVPVFPLFYRFAPLLPEATFLRMLES